MDFSGGHGEVILEDEDGEKKLSVIGNEDKNRGQSVTNKR
jgi:hypothetical protein